MFGAGSLLMATGQTHAVSRILFHLLLATGAISSAKHNGRMLTRFAVAKQSSTFTSDDILWSAQKVLDGCYNQTCIARTRGERHNWIRLDLQNVYKISSLVIYAVTEESCPTCPQSGLTDINIEMSKILHSPLCISTNVTTGNQKQNVTIKQTDDGHSLPDSRYITLIKAIHPLMIAEIQVFGDCPDNYCGRNCSDFCFCKTPLTSEEKTNGQSCHDGCLEGWEGEMCKTRKCMEGYGLNCGYECRCISGCDPWTGECLGADRRCYSGLSGLSCQRYDLNPLYQTNCAANDGKKNTCTSTWQYRISFKNPIPPSFVEITYKPEGQSSDQMYIQLPPSTDKLIYSRAAEGIGCGDKRQQVFQFSDVNVSKLTIQNIQGELCEIQFFVCSTGTFGPDCSSRCHCLNRKPCNSIDGACPDGKCESYWEGKACDSRCSSGTFGEDCSSFCHCINNQSCNYQTGKCPSGCSAGWTDNACNKSCLPGFFGVGCQNVCGQCRGGHFCQHISGHCSVGCEQGWQGPRCLQQDGGEAEYDYVPVEDLDSRSTRSIAVTYEFEQNCTDCDIQYTTNYGNKDESDFKPVEELGSNSTTSIATNHTDQNFPEFDRQNKNDFRNMIIISGSVGSVVIVTLAVVILCLLRFRHKSESKPIGQADVLEKHSSFEKPQHIYEEVQEDAELHQYYNAQSHMPYETQVKIGINIPVTQFPKICKKLLAAPKDRKPPLFYAFQSSEHVYERADQGTRESADGPELSYKALLERHQDLPEQAEVSVGQTSRKTLKINDISFLISDDSVTCVPLWETLVEQDIAICVHIGQPTIEKDEKLTFGSFTIECTVLKQADSVTECKLIAQCLQTELVGRITMLSCATWEEYMEVPIDLLGVINLIENLYNEMDKGGIIMIQCEHSINKAVLLSVASAILFKMKSTGLIDILGPVHDARLGVTGSIATYEQFKFLHEVVLFAIQKQRYCKEDTVDRHQRNTIVGV